jgi:hypothetical protein
METVIIHNGSCGRLVALHFHIATTSLAFNIYKCIYLKRRVVGIEIFVKIACKYGAVLVPLAGYTINIAPEPNIAPTKNIFLCEILRSKPLSEFSNLKMMLFTAKATPNKVVKQNDENIRMKY